MRQVVISAGDTSGDAHAAGISRALQAAIPGITITGIGDSALAATGAHLLADQRHMRQIGIAAIATSAPYHWRLGQRLIQHIADHQPDAVILVDYGGFHLRLARALRQKLPHWRGKLVYFIPPQVWASRPYRIQTLKQTVDLVLGILPFETALYQSHSIPYRFVGHPTTLSLPPRPADRAVACQSLGLNPQLAIVAVMPGSRRMELTHLLPVLKQTLPLIQAATTHSIQFVLAQAPGVSLAPVLAQWQADFAPHLSLSLTTDTHTLQAVADAAIVKSGTSTVETAWYGTPQVIIYKAHWATYWIYRRLATVPCLGMPNLLTLPDWQTAQPPFAYPECLQGDLNPYTLADHVLNLLEPTSPKAQRQAEANQLLKQRLRVNDNPYTLAARHIMELVNPHAA